MDIDLWIWNQSHYFFVTSTFSLFDKPLPDPRKQRIKPEQCFGKHVHCHLEIVVSADMAQFVNEDRLELFRCHSVGNAIRYD
jgi:hypothetical protein